MKKLNSDGILPSKKVLDRLYKVDIREKENGVVEKPIRKFTKKSFAAMGRRINLAIKGNKI